MNMLKITSNYNAAEHWLTPWPQDATGAVWAVRHAELWEVAAGGAVRCAVCYRRCTIREGRTGWCGYRRNEQGTMIIPDHGTLSTLVRAGLGSSGILPYHPGALLLRVGGIRCTARCVFCISQDAVREPEQLPWRGRVRGRGDGGFVGLRAVMPPRDVVDAALRGSADRSAAEGGGRSQSLEPKAPERAPNLICMRGGFDQKSEPGCLLGNTEVVQNGKARPTTAKFR